MIKNLIIALEALSEGKTIDDAYLLMDHLGFKDKMILVGHKGMNTLERIVTEPEWAKQPMDKVLIRFHGGPEGCPTRVFTASIRAYVIDRLIRTYRLHGLETALEAIRTVWGINVITDAKILQNS